MRACDRLHEREPEAGGAAGLGLALVQAVAGAHGGRATAANLPGGGAVVTLTALSSGRPRLDR